MLLCYYNQFVGIPRAGNTEDGCDPVRHASLPVLHRKNGREPYPYNGGPPAAQIPLYAQNAEPNESTGQPAPCIITDPDKVVAEIERYFHDLVSHSRCPP